MIGIIGHQLRALGHKAVWAPDNAKFILAGGWNVIVEGFTPQVSNIIADAYHQGARFICIATEEPSAKGFNQGTQKEMVKRQEWFPKTAPYLSGILHLVPGQHVTDWYGQHAPAAEAELGYAPSLVRKQMVAPKFDFGFYGSVSKRRLQILKRLAKRIQSQFAVRIVSDFKSQTDRDRAMQEARVIIQIRKFEEMGLVSSSRCNTALCIGRPVVAEPHLLSKPWDEIVTFASSMEGFYNAAVLTRSAWQGIHAAQMEKFIKALPPERCIGVPLQKIGIFGENIYGNEKADVAA